MMTRSSCVRIRKSLDKIKIDSRMYLRKDEKQSSVMFTSNPLLSEISMQEHPTNPLFPELTKLMTKYYFIIAT